MMYKLGNERTEEDFQRFIRSLNFRNQAYSPEGNGKLAAYEKVMIKTLRRNYFKDAENIVRFSEN